MKEKNETSLCMVEWREREGESRKKARLPGAVLSWELRRWVLTDFFLSLDSPAKPDRSQGRTLLASLLCHPK